MLKVLKFGGSSLADAARFQNVKDIISQDDSRRVVIVSAPGKRTKQDNKITDLLYLCYAHIQYGVDYSPMLAMIKSRYREIIDGLGISFDLDAEFDKIERHIKNGTDQDFIVSRGENLSAKIMAAYLGWDFVDASEHIIFNYDHSIDKEKTYELIKLAYNSSKGRIVVSGFYGTMPDGRLALMSRGGSDITGALVAAALEADVYENWTDVPGILMADPSIVKDPYPIPNISYDELRELTYLGAKVLHEASVFPVREAGIPVNIRDTMNPSHPGTLIAERFDEEPDPDKFYITGIAGRKNFSIIEVHHDNIADNVSMLRAALKVFENHRLSVEQLNSGVDGFTVLIPSDRIKSELYAVIGELESVCGPDSVGVKDNISLLAVVSRRMVFKSGISGLLFSALGENNVNIRIISQGVSELSIVIGVGNEDYEKAVRVLYDKFTQRGDAEK